MAGYCGYSMSNNAVAAYADGRKPLSKISAADLRDAGFPGTLKQAMALAKAGHWMPSEWHHTSKHYNRTDFYNPRDAVEALADAPDGWDAPPPPTVAVVGTLEVHTSCGVEVRRFTGQKRPDGWITTDAEGWLIPGDGGGISWEAV